MNKTTPIRWDEIDFSKIELVSEKKTQKIYYRKNKIEDLVIQMPRLSIPYGLVENENKSQYSNFKEYYMNGVLNEEKNFTEYDTFLKNFTDTIIKMINKNEDKEVCSIDNFYSLQKKSIKLNFARKKSGEFETLVFKVNKNKPEKLLINDSNITDYFNTLSVIVPTINCSRVFFFKEKYGITWNIVQCVVITSPSTTTTPTPTEKLVPQKQEYLFGDD